MHAQPERFHPEVGPDFGPGLQIGPHRLLARADARHKGHQGEACGCAQHALAPAIPIPGRANRPGGHSSRLSREIAPKSRGSYSFSRSRTPGQIEEICRLSLAIFRHTLCTRTPEEVAQSRRRRAEAILPGKLE